VRSCAWLLLLCFVPSCREHGASSGGDQSSHAPIARTHQADPSVRGLIVVLGSSTSAGIGPKQADNAWVPRYQAYLAARFPSVTLVNLAVGGYTTFHIQPTGYAPPPNRPAPVTGKNITAALALSPTAIIVNLPSNDQAGNYSLAEQLANYDRIANLTTSQHVQLWLSTTQPRNFGDAAQLDHLMQARDEVLKRFAPRALDFWTPFAAPNGFIQASYDSGDGIHLNDAAHAILADIVERARIPEQFPDSTQAAPLPGLSSPGGQDRYPGEVTRGPAGDRTAHRARRVRPGPGRRRRRSACRAAAGRRSGPCRRRARRLAHSRRANA